MGSKLLLESWIEQMIARVEERLRPAMHSSQRELLVGVLEELRTMRDCVRLPRPVGDTPRFARNLIDSWPTLDDPLIHDLMMVASAWSKPDIPT